MQLRLEERRICMADWNLPRADPLFGLYAPAVFHAEIVVDTDKVKREESHYQPIPIINDFKDADGNDCMKQAIQDNYNQIKEDVKQIVKDELDRIAADENLKHLIQK